MIQMDGDVVASIAMLTGAFYLGKYLASTFPEVYKRYFENNFAKFPGEE